MDLSVIVPLYNEEDSVTPLYEAIRAAIGPLGLEYEILFVDDGSRDRTFEVASELARGDPRLRVIKFRRNYGQTPAMVAGIDHARGEMLITMDGDLQNDPSDIPAFIDKIREGYDIVVGWRHKRKDKLVTRKIPSRIANRLIGKVTGVPIKDNGCSLKAYRGTIVKNIPLYSEMHRFIPAMSSLAGTRVAEIRVNHHARRFGKSKYGLTSIYKVLVDLLTIKTLLSFGSQPLRAFSIVAGASGLISVVAILASIRHIVLQPEESTIVFLGISFLFGALAVIMVFWGILAEIVYKTGTVKLETFAKLKFEDLEHSGTAQVI